MVKKLMADLSQDVLEKAQQAIDSGLKPALKWSNKQLDNTLNSLGSVGINFNPSQIQRMVKAKKQGKGMKLTLTTAQANNMKKQGGFLGALGATLAAPLVGSVVGEIGKAVRGKGHNVLEGQNRLPKDYFKRANAGYPVSLGSGLYLAPYTAGSGILDQMFPGAQAIHDDIVGIIQKGALNQGIKGMGIPMTRKGIANVIKKLEPTAIKIGEKVLLDQIKNRSVSATPTSGGGMILKYNGHQVKAGKGFLGNLVKTVGNVIPF